MTNNTNTERGSVWVSVGPLPGTWVCCPWGWARWPGGYWSQWLNDPDEDVYTLDDGEPIEEPHEND